MANLHVSISLTPTTRYTLRDEPLDSVVRITCITVGDDELTLHLDAWRGDAALVMTTGVLIDLLERVRAGARGRMAAAHTLPDALESATLADALRGMAPGEIVEAFGR